jgi:hypothetical protein
MQTGGNQGIEVIIGHWLAMSMKWLSINQSVVPGVARYCWAMIRSP